MSHSFIEQIIESIQKMDSELLYSLLDDKQSYLDSTKDAFIKKMNQTFSELRDFGDTNLIAHKGCCANEDCVNVGIKGYSFVGNHSKKHFSLIFVETEYGKTNIHDCMLLRISDKSVRTKGSVCLKLKMDEFPEFVPNASFLLTNPRSQLAYNEIIKYRNTIIKKNIYRPWLEKYSSLFKSMNSPRTYYYYYQKFYDLYNELLTLISTTPSAEFSKEAIDDFSTIDSNNELQLLKWLIKYEHAGKNKSVFFSGNIDIAKPQKGKYYEIYPLKIDASEYAYVKIFLSLFDKYYWKMLRKYNTFSREQLREIDILDDDLNGQISSLTYHIAKRKIKL